MSALAGFVVGGVLGWLVAEIWLEGERRRALRKWMARVREDEMRRWMTEYEAIPAEWLELFRAATRKDQP